MSYTVDFTVCIDVNFLNFFQSFLQIRMKFHSSLIYKAKSKSQGVRVGKKQVTSTVACSTAARLQLDMPTLLQYKKILCAKISGICGYYFLQKGLTQLER